MEPVQSAGGRPGKVKRRDGRLVTFDVARIESAVAGPHAKSGMPSRSCPPQVAAAVADAIALRV